MTISEGYCCCMLMSPAAFQYLPSSASLSLSLSLLLFVSLYALTVDSTAFLTLLPEISGIRCNSLPCGVSSSMKRERRARVRTTILETETQMHDADTKTCD